MAWLLHYDTEEIEPETALNTPAEWRVAGMATALQVAARQVFSNKSVLRGLKVIDLPLLFPELQFAQCPQCYREDGRHANRSTNLRYMAYLIDEAFRHL